ncbi:MAG: hypothetical protein QW727_01815 [Candidatus Pacearchaeota archaeon]
MNEKDYTIGGKEDIKSIYFNLINPSHKDGIINGRLPAGIYKTSIPIREGDYMVYRFGLKGIDSIFEVRIFYDEKRNGIERADFCILKIIFGSDNDRKRSESKLKELLGIKL